MTHAETPSPAKTVSAPREPGRTLPFLAAAVVLFLIGLVCYEAGRLTGHPTASRQQSVTVQAQQSVLQQDAQAASGDSR